MFLLWRYILSSLSSHYTPVLPVLLLSRGRHFIQDTYANRGIMIVLFFIITPVCNTTSWNTLTNRGIMVVLFFIITHVRKPGHYDSTAVVGYSDTGYSDKPVTVTLWPIPVLLLVKNRWLQWQKCGYSDTFWTNLEPISTDIGGNTSSNMGYSLIVKLFEPILGHIE